MRHHNIRNDVHALLRSRILSHEYPPGHRFDLREMTVRFGISQTPIKEALQRLEIEGLVTIIPRRGTFVATFDTLGMAETYDVRIALERFIAPLAVRNITQEELAGLRDLMARMAALLRAADAVAKLPQYIGLDFEFHCRIVSLARNKRMDEVYAQVSGPLQLARVMTRLSPETYVRFTEVEHRAIYDGLESRDAAALSAAFTRHMEGARVRISEWFARHPEETGAAPGSELNLDPNPEEAS